jgi:hypothetical protein
LENDGLQTIGDCGSLQPRINFVPNRLNLQVQMKKGQPDAEYDFKNWFGNSSGNGVNDCGIYFSP